MHILSKTLLLGVSVLFVSSGATSVSAKNPRVTVLAPVPYDSSLPQARIIYSDLNLALASGEKSLVRRVKGAVEVVCESHTQSGLATGYKRCRSVAWGGAEPQIARAVRRAREIASTGSSSIAATAITIVAP